MQNYLNDEEKKAAVVEQPNQEQQDAKPVAATEVKPAQQVSQQTTKPEQAQKANVNAAQKIGSAVGGFFDTVGDYVGGITDNIRAKKAQKNQEAREAPAKQEQAPIKHDDQKPHIDDVGLVDSQLKESAIHAKTESDFSASYFAAHKLDEEDGGIIVDGTFVADDNLDAMTAWKKATEYYRAQHGKNSEYKENYQYKGKLLPAGYKEEESKQLRPGSLEQPIADDQLSEYYEAIKARDEAAERDLPDDYIPMNIRERTAQASSETQTKQAEAPASAQVAKPEEKAAKKTEEKSEVKAEDQAQVAAKAVETPEGSQAKPAINAPASNAPAAAAPATASPATSTVKPAQTAPPAATPVANTAAPAGNAAPASVATPASTTQTASTGTEEPEDTYTKNEKFLKEQAEKQKEEVRKIYENEISGYDKLYEEAMKRKEALADLDKKRSKKENAYRYITGVGDLVSGFANLVGTAHNASHQDQTYVAPELVKKAEAARKERKLEMDALDKRLNEMRARKDALVTQRDTKLSEIDAKMVSDISKANLQKASDERALNIQGMKGEVEKAKQAGRIQVAEIKAASGLNNTRLRIQTTQGGRVKNATFYDANGKPQVLNVYSIDDVGEEIIKAVNANKASWSESEKEEYNNAVNKATLSSTYGGDGGEALELFYTKMAQKPYVYQHFKRLVGGTTSRTTTTSTTTTSGGSSVDSALEGL